MNMYLRLLVVAFRAWRRGRASALGPGRIPFRVRPTDLDPLGHMNNGVYFTLFDLGRIDLMLRSGLYRRFNKAGWFAVVSAETGTFRKELKPFRRFELETSVLGWDERHLYYEHRVLSRGRLATSAVIQIRFLSRSGERIEPQRVLDLLDEPAPRPALPDWVADWGKSSFEHAKAAEQSATERGADDAERARDRTA